MSAARDARLKALIDSEIQLPSHPLSGELTHSMGVGELRDLYDGTFYVPRLVQKLR